MNALSTAVLATLAFASAPAFPGDLTPPAGPVTSTMKTLDEVEARVPLSGPAPIAITEPGSYYLTENVIGVPGQPGITIGANDVTLDLNGFALLGVEGATSAVVPADFVSRSSVRDGAVSGWTVGVAGSASSGPDVFGTLTVVRVEGVAFADCSTAISVARTANVTRCSFTDCDTGAHVLGGVVDECVFKDCGSALRTEDAAIEHVSCSCIAFACQ